MKSAKARNDILLRLVSEEVDFVDESIVEVLINEQRKNPSAPPEQLLDPVWSALDAGQRASLNEEDGHLFEHDDDPWIDEALQDELPRMNAEQRARLSKATVAVSECLARLDRVSDTELKAQYAQTEANEFLSAFGKLGSNPPTRTHAVAIVNYSVEKLARENVRKPIARKVDRRDADRKPEEPIKVSADFSRCLLRLAAMRSSNWVQLLARQTGSTEDSIRLEIECVLEAE